LIFFGITNSFLGVSVPQPFYSSKLVLTGH
jgi:hypothetical protein